MDMKRWMKAAGIRAIKTVAQAAIATIGASMAMSEVDWKMVISASVLAGLLSLLTSIAGLPEIKEEVNPWADIDDTQVSEDLISDLNVEDKKDA